ncbi:hypothetical protein EGW08_000613 [Elysia chlorotica]|uniref:PDZ domain-containing protein n=1 Tax=Elysia chlorotica TaxID=188477 RepID=A0A3S1BU37_ELYCH|nr:hypothetical protein EGW08_000613 [Elysia chlorotica]
MDEKEEPETVEASLRDTENKPIPIRLMLYPDALLIQKQEWISIQLDEEDEVFLNMVREVEVTREPGAGFGLCVKGGSEHRLPVLISRLVKGEAAERCGQLLVGDAILRVIPMNYLQCFVICLIRVYTVLLYLKRTGSTLDAPDTCVAWTLRGELSLVLCYLPYSCIHSLFVVEKDWLYARCSRYVCGIDTEREDSFDIVGVDGSKSGPIHFKDKQTMNAWFLRVTVKIQLLLAQMVRTYEIIPSIQLMIWAHERTTLGQHWQNWREKFIALKAAEIFLFDTSPMHASDWTKCEMKYKVYECMFKILKDKELPDRRQHCVVIQTGSRETICLTLESRADLLALERAWYKTSNLAVQRLVSKTFGCVWQGHLSGLILDLEQGFSLYDHQTKSILWSYRFSQLKSSSDDGDSKLSLKFQTDPAKSLETQVIQCTDLQTLIYCIHSFLSAKLATVDPTFLGNH